MRAAHTSGHVCGRINSEANIGETLYAAEKRYSNLVEISVFPLMSTIVMARMHFVNMCVREMLLVFADMRYYSTKIIILP